MFIVVNVILVAVAFMLILIIAATSSIPSRQDSGLDSPDGEWMGPANLPVDRKMQQSAHSLTAVQRHMAASVR